MKSERAVAFAILAAVLWAAFTLQGALASDDRVAQAAAPSPEQGYLSANQMPDSITLLGPPPADGSGAKAGDVETYLRTRSLMGTPRWALAGRDAEFGPAPMMRDFSCAMGVELDRQSAPALLHLFDRLVADSEAIELKAKGAYKRPRPFVENGGPICVPEDPYLRSSYSYPAGHSTFGWLAGLVLAQLAPERSSQILARARSYGESRVVCGVHYESDVQAGRTTAAAVFSVVQDSPAFQADLAEAKRQYARLQTTSRAAPDPAECAMEAQASAQPVW